MKMEIGLCITINDFSSICRLCLNNNELKPIFKCNDYDQQSNSLSISPTPNRMISELCGLDVNPDDGFPLFVCSKCLNHLEEFSSFRAKCLSSAKILESLKEAEANNKQEAFNSNVHEKLECYDWPEYTDQECDDKSNVHVRKEKSKPQKKTNDSITDSKSKKFQTKPKTIAKKTNIQKPKKGKRKKQCEICGSLTQCMASHKQKHLNSDGKNFECDSCGKKFSDKNNLKQHLKTHLNIKNFACTLCPSKFDKNSLLLSHMKIHDNKREFKCSKCSLSFNQKKVLQQHFRYHNQIRNKPCPYCDKLFLRNDNLRDHIKTHTREKTFKCEVCDEWFITSATLCVHKRKHKIK